MGGEIPSELGQLINLRFMNLGKFYIAFVTFCVDEDFSCDDIINAYMNDPLFLWLSLI